MANLGKVVITPKGEYVPGESYVRLDCVYYNGSSWLALQTSTDIEPEEGAYWILLAQGFLTDTKDNTVSFVEAAGDGELKSGDTHATLFGLIKKKLSDLVIGKIDKSSIVQTTAVSDTTKVPSAAVTNGISSQVVSLENSITSLNNNLAQLGVIAGYVICSPDQGGYVTTSMLPILNAEVKTITLTSSALVGVGDLTVQELALLTVQRLKTGINFVCTDNTLKTKIAGKCLDIKVTVA